MTIPLRLNSSFSKPIKYLMTFPTLVVLASGNGSNFQAIIDNIESGQLQAEVKHLITNSDNAYALERAELHNIPSLSLPLKKFKMAKSTKMAS